VKVSARNQLPGKIVSAVHGAVNSTIKVDLGGGLIVTSMITNGAVADLGLAVGDDVTVLIKASDVMIGK